MPRTHPRPRTSSRAAARPIAPPPRTRPPPPADPDRAAASAHDAPPPAAPRARDRGWRPPRRHGVPHGASAVRRRAHAATPCGYPRPTSAKPARSCSRETAGNYSRSARRSPSRRPASPACPQPPAPVRARPPPAPTRRCCGPRRPARSHAGASQNPRARRMVWP